MLHFIVELLENATLEGRVTKMSVWNNTYPHKPLRKRSGHPITMLTDHFMWGLIHWSLPYRSMQDVVKHHKNSNPFNPVRTSKHCEVLIRWTQLNGYVVSKNNLISIIEICSYYWSTKRNLVTKISHNIVKTTHISASGRYVMNIIYTYHNIMM